MRHKMGNESPRVKPASVTLPRVYSLPCPVHPNDMGLPKAPKRCGECLRVNRRARFAAMGESIGSLYASTRNRANKHGYEFTLTEIQFGHILSLPCVYAYTAINGLIRAKVGIDRKDSSKGYTYENSQPCCPRHNLFKSNILTHEQASDAIQRYRIPCGSCNAGRKRIA
jgi:hypothetical protein